ncbi:carbon-nitrogen hydrolase family protein [Hyperthermus butylicus]|uniref:Amidohydrolase n=1 Tax=Hyperthermus butylicus (strain DSM 5456 / JCM 9403 / PLM1-5) TaxID=415426 RepID=A2BNC1_HYPBU|nr:carbon-nitrogen hydrolase family protein [Hyperthermus butylicus]ABM81482.1 putative amidohydrolase [Hyperthermus butylicus DSM 5456]
MQTLTIALLQFGATHSKEESLERIRKLISRYERIVSEADLLLVPEYSMADPTGQPPEAIAAIAEPLEGPWIGFFARLAREYSVHVVATLYEKSKAGGKPYNTAALIAPTGELLAVYRKIHLFDAYGYRESDYFMPGAEPAKLATIKGFRIALAVCFDLRFPELFRTYALQGAELVAVPAAWYRGPAKEDQLRIIAAARAHENTMYIAVASQYNSNFTGRSLVADPYGLVLLDAGRGEKIVQIEVDRESLEEARRQLPLLKLRRPHAYKL